MRSRARLGVPAALVCLVAACGSSASKAAVLPPPVRSQAAAQRCEGIRLALAHLPSPGTVNGSVVILGDSYTAGVGASDAAHGYPDLLAARLGRRVVPVGLPGSGFAAPGPCGDLIFAAELPTVMALRPSVVVVAGGLNDVREHRQAAALTAASTLLASLERDLPAARRLVVAPATPAPALAGPIAAFGDGLADRARTNGAGFASWADDFLPGHPQRVGPDHLHPDDQGETALAATLVAPLRALIRSSANSARKDTGR